MVSVDMPKGGQEFGVREKLGCSCCRLTFPFGLAFLNTLWRERGLARRTPGKAPAGPRTRGLEPFLGSV